MWVQKIISPGMHYGGQVLITKQAVLFTWNTQTKEWDSIGRECWTVKLSQPIVEIYPSQGIHKGKPVFHVPETIIFNGHLFPANVLNVNGFFYVKV